MIAKQLLIGMPESGKSTYIAALRYQLVSEEIDTKLKLIKLSDIENRLNQLEKQWIKSEVLKRTNQEDDEWVKFHIKDNLSENEGLLCLPDFSGETFRKPAARGICKTDLYEAIKDCNGIILFTNADRPIDNIRICEYSDMDLGDEPEKIVNTRVHNAFNPDAMPEEANLVEILQIFNRKPLKKKYRRIVIIISAWDVVPKNQSPLKWFREHRPMLDQYLISNSEQWQVCIFGVSAQGGKLPSEKDKLENILNPSERVKLVDESSSISHDLTIPLQWLLNQVY